MYTRRVHTAYLEGGPFDYQYQDMGPMRFPETIQYAGSNETIPVNDMKLVFQLADVMNELNKGDDNFTVKFIPWIQNNPNGLYYYNGIKKPDGLPPTVTEIQTNPNLTAQIPVDPLVTNITDRVTEIACSPEVGAAAAKNVFTAHKAWLDSGLGGLGGDDWSEFAYFHNHLQYSLNVTDQALAGGSPADGLWDYMYGSVEYYLNTEYELMYWSSYECEYFGATTWRTIDGVSYLHLCFDYM